MKTLLASILLLSSLSSFAGCFSFNTYRYSDHQTAFKITSCTNEPVLYIVTRNEGKTAPRNCDSGKEVFAQVLALVSIDLADKENNSGKKYSYRMCAYTGGSLAYQKTSTVTLLD